MFNLVSVLTSRKWVDKQGGKHKATRVFDPDAVPKDVCVIRSSHSPEVCHCRTCQDVVRDKFRYKMVTFVDYVSWEIAK